MIQPQHNDPAGLAPFEAILHTRLVFGNGAIQRLGELALELGAERVLMVTDPGLVAAGHVEPAEHILRASGLEVARYDRVQENPTTTCVEECRDAARAAGANLLVSLGGGSAMDTAKGCNFLLTNGGRMQDYWGVGKASKPMLPLIAVPTTAGTGSECQSAALVSDIHTHQKMACLDPKAAPRIAVLDPMLTLTLPPLVTALTGLDALAHAIESAVTTRRNPISSLFSREAFGLLRAGFPRVINHPEDLEARGRMQLGAALAGCAIENSMLGAAHSAANPLTTHYHLPHGQAVSLMLPHVIRFNGAKPMVAEEYAKLVGESPETAVDTLASLVEAYLDLAGIPRHLETLGIEAARIPTLADEAALQWTAQFNPRPVTAPDFAQLYSQGAEH